MFEPTFVDGQQFGNSTELLPETGLRTGNAPELGVAVNERIIAITG
jgi:hypothetical protein